MDVDKLVAGRELDELVELLVMEVRDTTLPHLSKSQSASNLVEKRLSRLGWSRIGKDRRPAAPSGLNVTVQLLHEDG